MLDNVSCGVGGRFTKRDVRFSWFCGGAKPASFLLFNAFFVCAVVLTTHANEVDWGDFWLRKVSDKSDDLNTGFGEMRMGRVDDIPIKRSPSDIKMRRFVFHGIQLRHGPITGSSTDGLLRCDETGQIEGWGPVHHGVLKFFRIDYTEGLYP